MMDFMDDELAWEDSSDVVKAFIDYAAKRYVDRDCLPPPAPPVVRERPVTGGRLCFVITRSKASSWVEDLSEMVSIEERTRIYN